MLSDTLVWLNFCVFLIIVILIISYFQRLLKKRCRIQEKIKQSENRRLEKINKLAKPLLNFLIKKHKLSEMDLKMCVQAIQYSYIDKLDDFRTGRIYFTYKNMELFPQISFIVVNGIIHPSYIDIVESPWETK